MIQNYNNQVNINQHTGANTQFYHSQGLLQQHLGNAQNQKNFRSPNSLENMGNLEQSNYHINRDTINNINKLPTTISFNQEGQFSIAKSIIEKDSLNNSKNSQVPQLSTYQGNPQELVNLLSERIYQLVEQVHKLSSIIEEMTTNQQILSEKYVKLRAIYYQVLIDRNLNPAEKDQQWLIMNKSQKGISVSSPNSPRRHQEIADQIRITSNNTSPYHSNQQSQQGLSQQEALRGVQFNGNDNERVKKSRIKNLDQQQKGIQNSCMNCQQRELEQQILREHVSQMEKNLNNANKEIQNLKQLIEIQQKQQNQNTFIHNSLNMSSNFQDKSPSQSNSVSKLLNNSLQKVPESQQINNYFKSPKNSQTEKNSPDNSFINIQKRNNDLNNSALDQKSPKQLMDDSPYQFANRTPNNFQNKLDQDNNRSSNNQSRSPKIVQNQAAHNYISTAQQPKGNNDLSNQNLNKKQPQQIDISPSNVDSRTPKNVQNKPDLQDFNKNVNNSYLQKSNMDLVYQNNQTPKQSQNLTSNMQNNKQMQKQNDDSSNIRNLIRPLQFGENYNQQAQKNKSYTPKSNQGISYPQNAYPGIQNNSQTPKGNIDLNHHQNQIYNQNSAGNNQPAYQIVINQYTQKPNFENNQMSNQMKSPKQNSSNVYSNLDTFNSIQPQKVKVDPNNVSLKDSIEVFKQYLHEQQVESMKKNNESSHNNSPSKQSKIYQTSSSNKASKSKNISNKDNTKLQKNSRTNSISNQNNVKINNPQYQQNPK
ncbi:hypothetical protein ABPG72_002617 [Tetrahymena utriculariae]